MVRKAEDHLHKNEAAMSAEEIWGTKMRKRTLTAGVTAMNSASSALAPYFDDPAVEALAGKLNCFCDAAEKRFDLLALLRQNPFSVVDEKKLTDEQHEILLDMSIPMLSNLILFVAGEAMKMVCQERGLGI